MRLLPLSVLLTATLVVPLRPAGAQAPASFSLRASNIELAAAVALQPRASIASEQPAPLVNDSYAHDTRHEGVVLMIVGAAGIVTGLIIDEPVVTILSAGVGGAGLYLYLR